MIYAHKTEMLKRTCFEIEVFNILKGVKVFIN
jgi:hypothetical protein